jgi:hypothetical protein
MAAKSEDTTIHQALSAFQGEVHNAAKGSVNPHYGNQYADLATILNTVREPLAKHGLSVTQTTRLEGGEVVLVTTLWHSSGGSIVGEYPVIPQRKDPQGYGSAMTYARRYTLAAILGIAQEDDDGQAASTPPKSQPKATKRPPAPKAAPVADPTPDTPILFDAKSDERKAATAMTDDEVVRAHDLYQKRHDEAKSAGKAAVVDGSAKVIAVLEEVAASRTLTLPPFVLAFLAALLGLAAMMVAEVSNGTQTML